ncbi:MAG: hypothetical protein N3F65_03875 [Nitrososphaeria archaeon]|nr:hypothetical protein [Nitrososphaeria archaeon]
MVARGAIPLLKGPQIIIDDTSSNPPITMAEITSLALKFLTESGIKFEKYSMAGKEVVIEDEEPRPRGESGPRIFICPHCGFTTIYEEEYWVHLKIHYAGF